MRWTRASQGRGRGRGGRGSGRRRRRGDGVRHSARPGPGRGGGGGGRWCEDSVRDQTSFVLDQQKSPSVASARLII